MLIDSLPERDAALSALVAYRRPRLSEGPNPFALDHLLVAVLVDERDGDVRHTKVSEEGEQMVAQAPLAVCLRCRAELGLPRRPPARRKHVERLIGVADRLRARRPPDPDVDLGEHPIKHSLGLAVRPPIGVRAERQDLAPTVRPDTEAAGDLPVPTLVHPDLSARPLLHNACLTLGAGSPPSSRPRGDRDIGKPTLRVTGDSVASSARQRSAPESPHTDLVPLKVPHVVRHQQYPPAPPLLGTGAAHGPTTPLHELRSGSRFRADLIFWLDGAGVAGSDRGRASNWLRGIRHQRPDDRDQTRGRRFEKSAFADVVGGVGAAERSEAHPGRRLYRRTTSMTVTVPDDL